ncbi:MAG: hypothetical protein PHT07_03915 [Paludibacter sp.]|nr:hypothetical protein [Paludibacter sp.]
MKFIKGCLMSLIVLFVICIIGYFIFKNHVIKNLGSLKNNVELNWNKCVENLKERNAELSQYGFKNDSIKYYLESKGKIISLSECSEELEFNEYKVNQFVMSDGLVSDVNNKLNSNLNNYNQAVREYNLYRVTFPILLIARKTKFHRYYNYFDIRYGVNNDKIMIKKRKMENWVKNGGTFPE